MLNRRIFVLTIIFSAVYNFSYAFKDCEVKKGFDVDKLEGLWKFIAAISPRKENSRCGYIILNKQSETKFTGSRISWHHERLVMVPITVEVYADHFILQLVTSGLESKKFEMSLKTCNGDTEFAIEDPKHKLYLIFSRTNTVSRSFLRHYRNVAFGIKSKLQMIDRKCF